MSGTPIYQASSGPPPLWGKEGGDCVTPFLPLPLLPPLLLIEEERKMGGRRGGRTEATTTTRKKALEEERKKRERERKLGRRQSRKASLARLSSTGEEKGRGGSFIQSIGNPFGKNRSIYAKLSLVGDLNSSKSAEQNVLDSCAV